MAEVARAMAADHRRHLGVPMSGADLAGEKRTEGTQDSLVRTED